MRSFGQVDQILRDRIGDLTWAVFRPDNQAGFLSVMALGTGIAAGLGGAGKVGGASAASLPGTFARRADQERRRTAHLPELVIVAVAEDVLYLVATDRQGNVGRTLAELVPGQFTAAVRTFPGEVDLDIRVPGKRPYPLRARRGLLHKDGIRVARAVACLGNPE